jgi:hypothetical protein
LTLATRRDGLERDIRRKAEAQLARWTGPIRRAVSTRTGERARFTRWMRTRLRAHLRHHPALAGYDPLTALAQAELHEAEARCGPDWGGGSSAWQHRGPAFDDMMSGGDGGPAAVSAAQRQTPLIAARRAGAGRSRGRAKTCTPIMRHAGRELAGIRPRRLRANWTRSCNGNRAAGAGPDSASNC